MKGLSKFKSNVEGECFIFVDNVGKFVKDVEDPVKHFFSPFLMALNISAQEFLLLKEKAYILDRELYDFSIFPHGIPVAPNGIYAEKWNKVERRRIRTNHDVYITNSEFSSLYLAKILNEYIKKNFPRLFEGNFVKTANRFSDNVKSIFISPSMSIRQLDGLLGADSITIDDLMKIMADKGYVNSIVCEPKVKMYANNDGSTINCYLDIDNGHSIAFDFKDLMGKDWKAIEDKDVWVDHKYNGVKQKDRDYFSSPLTWEFKETFFS